MNELSLFTGIGGGLLGTKLLGWRSIGYVEIDQYCQRVLQQRVKDGILDDAPIFGDIREFNRTYAEEFKGVADVITAGFPCQPFSVAGKRKAAEDDRNMWPSTIKTISIVRPAFILLENVPGLLSHEYAITIINDLTEIQYEVLPPLKVGADDIGANHRRKRIWIMAYTGNRGISECGRQCGVRSISQNEKNRQTTTDNISTITESNLLADTADSRTQGMCKRENSAPENVSDTDNSKTSRQRENGRKIYAEPEPKGSDVCGSKGWWSVEPDLGRLAHGVPNRVDRLRAIGNAQVPIVVKAVWELLNEE